MIVRRPWNAGRETTGSRVAPTAFRQSRQRGTLAWRTGPGAPARTGRVLDCMVPGTQQRGHHNTPTWVALLRGLAILSLFLLPTSYRGGADAAHAHTFFQLWADATDGHIDHHLVPSSANVIFASWLDPRVEMREEGNTGRAPTNQVDPGTHEDSTPATTSIHMMMATITVADSPSRAWASPFISALPLTGFQPAVLSPPPR